MGNPLDVVDVSRPASVELAAFLGAVDAEGFRVAVEGILDWLPAKAFGGSSEGLLDGNEDSRVESL